MKLLPSGGKMKQRIIEKKKEEMQDYMGQVRTLLAKYTPPDPQKMERARGPVSPSPVQLPVRNDPASILAFRVSGTEGNGSHYPYSSWCVLLRLRECDGDRQRPYSFRPTDQAATVHGGDLP